MKIKLLSPEARVPQRAENGAAGYDLFLPDDFVIKPGRNVVPLRISIELDPGTEANIRPRSGFSAKGMAGEELNKPNSVQRFDADVTQGTIDESYRGEVGVIIKNFEKFPFTLTKGTKIAQMVIGHYCSEKFEVVEELSETDRGEGGFGHTGTK